MHRIVIADPSREFCTILSGALRSRFLVEVCSDGRQALSLLRKAGADVLILDLMLQGPDGMDLLKMVRQEELAGSVIVTSLFFSDYIARTLTRYSVDYATIKPCSVYSLVERVAELCDSHSWNPEQEDPHCAVSGVLLALGFQTHRKGYRFIRESILMLIRDPALQATKTIYPDVGKRCGANPYAVEKAIRTAIASAWEARDNDVWRLYFPAAPDGQVPRPTNTEFLTRIADALSAAHQARRA
ncbi:MAG: response regulator [Oscillospiraceae bacterium]|nr:response regulator [Oscillospiraceae bacterium]